MPRTGNKWDQRIERARELAADYPYSTQILLFYAKLTAFQKDSYLQFQSSCSFGNGRCSALPSRLDEVDLALLLTRSSPFLSMIASEAPGSLAEFARGLQAHGPSSWTALLRESWPGDSPPESGDHSSTRQNQPDAQPEQNPFERFCAQTFLQPYAEFLADRAHRPEPPLRRPACPYCGSPPLVGVLRQEGDGAKRSLVCSWCRSEWDYLRLACPACEERDEKRLCVYTTEAFPHMRVEACDTCRSSLTTIDLTRNGLAVPEVDELAALPLALWTQQNGYRKVSPNFIGL